MSDSKYSEQKLEQALRSLPREVSPPPALWQQIEANLDGHPQHAAKPQVRTSWWLASAASVLFCALLLWSTQTGDDHFRPGPGNEHAIQQLTYEQTVRSYEQALAAYAGQLGDSDSTAEIADWETIRWQWQMFEQARDVVRDAMVQSPESDVLSEQLMFIYQQHLVWAQTVATTLHS